MPTRNCCNKRGELIKGGNYCNKRGEASPSAQAGGGARIWRSRAVRVVGPTLGPLRARGAPHDLAPSFLCVFGNPQVALRRPLISVTATAASSRLKAALPDLPIVAASGSSPSSRSVSLLLLDVVLAPWYPEGQALRGRVQSERIKPNTLSRMEGGQRLLYS